MSRSHYTHSADFIRGLGPVNRGGVVLSRYDASKIRDGIAEAIGMDKEELSKILSNAQENQTPEQIEEQMKKLINAIGIGNQ